MVEIETVPDETTKGEGGDTSDDKLQVGEWKELMGKDLMIKVSIKSLFYIL